jgi:hypothetical protein
VFIEPDQEDNEALSLHLQKQGVLIGIQKPPIRLVTHLDIDDVGIDRVITAVDSFYR